MAAIPSLSSAFSSLLGGLFAPAVPKTTAPSAPQIGPSSLSALGIKAPAVPNVSAISVANAANPHTGANASYVNPANATASKGTVPYVPATPQGGGISLVPTSTSAKTGLPTSSVPGAVSPASSQGYTPPALPALPSTSSFTGNSGGSTSTPAAAPSTNLSAGPAIPNLAESTPSLGAPAAPGAALGVGASTGGGSGGGISTAGAQPLAWNAFGTSPSGSNPSDPYGLSYFSSTEQQKAEKALQDSLTMSPEEVQAQRNLNNLNTSASSAYTNAEGQSIPLPFITGQQAQIQREQGVLAQPLEQQLSLMQAQRQLAGTAAQAAVTQANSRIASYDDFLKPVPTTYGGTLSQFDPTTGTYKTLVNPFGTATGTANGTSSGDITSQIGGAIANGQLTQDMVTRYGIPFIAATLKADPGYNFVTQKASVGADAASLKTQQAYVDTVTRAFNTANDNLNSLTGFMTQYGINQSSVPLINQLTNKVKAGAADPGSIAAFNSALSGLRAEYAQVLSRGGEVTDSSRATAASLIPDNISPAQLQQVAARLNTEGTNAISEATQQVSTIKGRVGSNSGGSTNLGTSGSSSNPFSASNFFGT